MAEGIDPAARESGAGGEQGKDNRDAIIKRLQAERDKARTRWDEQQQAFGALQQQVQDLAAKLNGQGQNPDDNGGLLRGANDAVLNQALQKAVEGGDHGLQAETLQEMIRRTVEKAVGTLPDQVKQSMNMDDHRQRVLMNLEEGYKDMLAPDSPEFAQASELASGLRRTYGDDVLKKYPELYELALLKVKQAQHDKLREQLHDKDSQLEQLRMQLHTVSSGGAPPLHDAAKAALDKGDTKGAIGAITARLLGVTPGS